MFPYKNARDLFLKIKGLKKVFLDYVPSKSKNKTILAGLRTYPNLIFLPMSSHSGFMIDSD